MMWLVMGLLFGRVSSDKSIESAKKLSSSRRRGSIMQPHNSMDSRFRGNDKKYRDDKSVGSITYGNPKAKDELIDYFDIGCEHCVDFYRHTFPILKKKFCDTGKLKFVFKPYPVHLETVIFMACWEVLNVAEKQMLFETLMELDHPSEAAIQTCMKVLKKPYKGPTSSALKEALLITKKHDFDSLPVMFLNQKRLTDDQQDHVMEFLSSRKQSL